MKSKLIALAAAMAISPIAFAGDQDVYITEVMYTGLFGEFIEVTNTASALVDLDGWRFDDNSADFATATELFDTTTELGLNETIVITEVSAAVFTQAWFTDAGHATPGGLVAIFENNSNNLGRNDEVNIYNDGGTPVDKLTFNDQAATGTNPRGPRTEEFSAVPGVSTVLGDNIFKNWVLSAVGTGNAWKAGAAAPVPGSVGSPGQYPN
ncbi:MAG: lamin tail domain-containing protein [Verrucomicrobiaceae bacterium]|nr:MAG: lamin tail domain-containing protein [Verrucomicrobiaceae bacterium]